MESLKNEIDVNFEDEKKREVICVQNNSKGEISLKLDKVKVWSGYGAIGPLVLRAVGGVGLHPPNQNSPITPISKFTASYICSSFTQLSGQYFLFGLFTNFQGIPKKSHKACRYPIIIKVFSAYFLGL